VAARPTAALRRRIVSASRGRGSSVAARVAPRCGAARHSDRFDPSAMSGPLRASPLERQKRCQHESLDALGFFRSSGTRSCKMQESPLHSESFRRELSLPLQSCPPEEARPRSSKVPGEVLDAGTRLGPPRRAELPSGTRRRSNVGTRIDGRWIQSLRFVACGRLLCGGAAEPRPLARCTPMQLAAVKIGGSCQI
jgi:hypothetical protein